MQWSAMVKMRGFPWFPLAKTNQDLLKKCNPRSKNFKKSLKTETTGWTFASILTMTHGPPVRVKCHWHLLTSYPSRRSCQNSLGSQQWLPSGLSSPMEIRPENTMGSMGAWQNHNRTTHGRFDSCHIIMRFHHAPVTSCHEVADGFQSHGQKRQITWILKQIDLRWIDSLCISCHRHIYKPAPFKGCRCSTPWNRSNRPYSWRLCKPVCGFWSVLQSFLVKYRWIAY